MYAGEDFITTTPNEIRYLSFDFQDAFISTDPIVSCVWTCAVALDSPIPDPGAASHISLPSQSGQIASAALQQCLIGVKYVIHCVATASSGQKAEFESYIWCQERI